jgi:hypothetical protein
MLPAIANSTAGSLKCSVYFLPRSSLSSRRAFRNCFWLCPSSVLPSAIFGAGSTARTEILAAGAFKIDLRLNLHRIPEFQKKGAPIEWVRSDPILARAAPRFSRYSATPKTSTKNRKGARLARPIW